MTTKIKTTLLTGFLFFALLTGLQAQDKYEYATVTYNVAGRKIVFSTSLGDYEESAVDWKATKNTDDYRQPLKKIVELADKGWELLESYPTAIGTVYNMRKKKS